MGRQRARKGTGSIYERGDRFVAQLTIAGTDGSQKRRTATFETRTDAEAWLLEQRTRRSEQAGPVSDQTVADYLRWWIDTEAPKGKPGRAPLAETTLTSYRSNIELHLIPAFGRKRVGELTVRDLDDFASAKLAEGLAPATINRMRETLRSALSTAVRQDRLSRNVARYGGGVGVEPPPVDWFSEDELRLILKAAQGEHFHAIVVLLARTGLRVGEACGLRWRDVVLHGDRPRLSVVWQLDKWARLVRPKSPTSRRTVPLRREVVDALEEWRAQQDLWRSRLEPEWADEHGLIFTTRTGLPISKRNVARAFTRYVERAGLDHGTLKTLRSTVATQLAEAGVHPKKAQAFLGHAHMSTTMKYYTAVGDISDLADSLPEL